MTSKAGAEFFRGRYIFHCHTRHTDGKLDVRDYFEFAKSQNAERLLFLEHIRRDPTYDVAGYLREVRENAAAYGIPARVGFEAKHLPDGSLDISGEHLDAAEIIGVAEHGYPADATFEMWRDSFLSLLDSLRPLAVVKPVVWVHPGLWLKKRKALDTRGPEYTQLLLHAGRMGFWIEKNMRYGLFPDSVEKAIPAADIVQGVDAHTAAELQKASRAWA